VTQSKKPLGVSELIQRVKQDLLAAQSSSEPDLFSIDEITLEVNFTVDGDIDSGFDLGIVTLGSKISEERVQRIILKMTPLVSKQQLLDTINQDSQKAKAIVTASSERLIRGGGIPVTRGDEQGRGTRRG
jgi:hypothetical protein